MLVHPRAVPGLTSDEELLLTILLSQLARSLLRHFLQLFFTLDRLKVLRQYDPALLLDLIAALIVVARVRTHASLRDERLFQAIGLLLLHLLLRLHLLVLARLEKVLCRVRMVQ